MKFLNAEDNEYKPSEGAYCCKADYIINVAVKDIQKLRDVLNDPETYEKLKGENCLIMVGSETKEFLKFFCADTFDWLDGLKELD